ncbi:uncharacterized protein LOC118438630 [Folsomia candida]|uniref:uncharacterized protein LOC118438630 n=1 Tax=Folsomia candida TaxID=158441 RepID=UPI001604CD47|nr:uncharacterized protein LOC118438630 [Folsomia candida]
MGVPYTIINKQCNTMALSIYNSTLSAENKIHTAPHVSNCSDLSQVFRLQTASGYYEILSALGLGSIQWTWNMHLHYDSDPTPTIARAKAQYSQFSLQLVDATNFYTIRVRESPQASFYYSGIRNDIGVDVLTMVPPDPGNHTHLWGFVQCPK